MRKKIITAIALLLCIVPTANAIAQECPWGTDQLGDYCISEDGDYWYTESNDTITINRYVGLGGDVVIPATINNLPVVSIDTWTNIFLRGMSYGAFEQDIGPQGDPLYESPITSVTIPDSVTSIGFSTFSGCTSLTSVTIGNSVTSIGEHAFSGCTSLTSVTIPDSVTSIGRYAFAGCDGLIAIDADPDSLVFSSQDGVLYNKDKTSLILFPAGFSGSFIIPDSVTSIGFSAFSGCSGLTSVTISDSVTSIGDYAFASCRGLTSVTIPDSVTSIGFFAFSYCSSLTSVTIPDSVTSIGDYVFFYCSGLTSVTIGNSVTSIGDHAFYNCDGLTSVSIPDSVTSIGSSAFASCSGLTSVTIGNGVTSIGFSAFSYCSGLTSVTIGTSVISIGDSAFYRCVGLTSVAIPDSVTSIGSSAFYDCDGLTSVTIPDSVTSIGSSAFYDCDGLTSVTIPDSVTSIEGRAFYSCTDLTTAYFFGNAPTMGTDVFLNTASDFTVCYISGATGFATPIWEPYPGDMYSAAPCADDPPVIGDGPFVVDWWVLVPTVQEQAMLLAEDRNLLWAFSDDYASCSGDCTHAARYQKVGDSIWKALSVVDGPSDWAKEVSLPVSQLQNGTYAFQFSVTDCAGQTTQSGTYYFKVDRPDQPPVFLSEPRWVGGVWPVLSTDPAHPHTATSELVVFFAFDDDKVDCQGVSMQKYWMYRPVELQAGEAVPQGDGSWTYEVPGWSYMYWVLLEEPTIADTTGPGLFEFKLSVTDCHDQTTDTEGFWGDRYYFLVE